VGRRGKIVKQHATSWLPKDPFFEKTSNPENLTIIVQKHDSIQKPSNMYECASQVSGYFYYHYKTCFLI
jgi:hypothetical protein